MKLEGLIHGFVLLQFMRISLSDDRIPLKVAFLSSTSKSTVRLFAGAFFTALDHVNKNESILEGHRLDYLFHDTNESSLNAINAMTSDYGNNTVGFIGPDNSCVCESTVAAAWNLPMLGYKCHDFKIDKNDENLVRGTFARTQPSTSKISKYIISVLQYFKWKRFTMVVGTTAIWNETADSLIALSKQTNIYVNKVAYFKEPYASYDDDIMTLVESTNTRTRIYVFLGDNHALIDFLRLLKAIVGDNSSQYVVIAMDERLYTDDPEDYVAKGPFETIDYLSDDHLEAFEMLMLLVPRPPINDKWDEFLDDVRKRNAEDPINGMPMQYAGIRIKVPIYAAFLYDAVNTYALALDKVLKRGHNPKNGTLVIQEIRNRTFTSILGYDVYVDPYGDAEGNYTLVTFRRHVSSPYIDMIPNANFRMVEPGIAIPELNIFEEILWRKYIPLDEPECGFDGERCIEKFNWQIVTVSIIVATVSLIAGGFCLRHYLYEQKLDRLLWKVDFKDIVLVDWVDEVSHPVRKKGRTKSHPWKFILSYENESERATLLGDVRRETTSSNVSKRCLMGSFKGTTVSVKRIIKKNVEINRDLKKQLQLRKELNHDNISRFIGACVETPYVYILTQFSQKGSLHDILQNEDFSLDDMFTSSLVSDLIKGMIFIHDSDFNSHGNLKSSNCLVDSRWVLTITDFGLHSLVNERSGSVTDVQRYFDRMLWTAPELLRNNNRSPSGTQKGDVYSFAIILYEMIGRKGPWGDNPFSSRDIVENLKAGKQDFRPSLTELECDACVLDCLMDCWHEDPEQRPDFKYIRFRLKNILQGIKSNIFDNMLSMMEKYANNLEGLVAERTEQLSEEKKMTENLLLRMLPRFVADRLKKGEPVVPELYESVSIYFSDIVGFTALSAESTPMEVVCMLNDLYTCFDAIVENYDCYKIETIGDAYFVVSGLPVRNDNLHAGEIASMSLHMQRAIKSFKIKHRPDDTLKLRIGIHSGSCVAGVVGLKMPRYTLFGDTVNTASRMETTGVPLKIHCSEVITKILQELGGYHLVERGFINAKGKGEMLTYFLESEDELHRRRRISNTNFSRTSSPNSPTHDAQQLFGGSTLHPKYWPDSHAGKTSVGDICDLHACDNRQTDPTQALCDINKEVTDPVLKVQKRLQNAISTSVPHFDNFSTNAHVTVPSDWRPQFDRNHSVSFPVNSNNGRLLCERTSKDDGLPFIVKGHTEENGKIESIPLLGKAPAVPVRQTSLPMEISEQML